MTIFPLCPLSDQDRVFTVDHVIRKGGTRLDPKADPQPGPDVFRFKLAVAKGKTASQEIVEERVFTNDAWKVSLLSDLTVREYLAHSAPSAEVKAALTRAMKLHNDWLDTQRQLSGLEATLKITSDDQVRLRENLKIIPQTSDPYKRFLDKFVAQETEIENLQKSIRQTQAIAAAAQREYAAFVAGLNAD
jgi:hypothetical protein